MNESSLCMATVGRMSGLMKSNSTPSLLYWLLLFSMVPALSGCSTLTASDVYNADLQAEIRAGNLVEAGDYVIIHTQDNVKHEFTVTTIDKEYIEGESVSVQIDDIAALKVESIDVERTVGAMALTGLGLYVLYLGALLASFGLLF